MVIVDTFTKPLTSEHAEFDPISPLNEQSPKNTSLMTIHKPEPQADNINFQVFKCEGNVATLMPNTSEFKELSLNEETLPKVKRPQKWPVSTPSVTSERKPSSNASEKKANSLKRRIRGWRILLGVLWALCFTAIMILITLHNIAKDSNAAHKQETKKQEIFEHTNYQICLLIARNCRRLIVSSIPFINSNVN